ncbi:ankyrin repeat domain-containing protein [Parashewanella spongiae]|nr:ankyrin repeat domain-containing protein [Parashewanella spongiae]
MLSCFHSQVSKPSSRELDTGKFFAFPPKKQLTTTKPDVKPNQQLLPPILNGPFQPTGFTRKSIISSRAQLTVPLGDQRLVAQISEHTSKLSKYISEYPTNKIKPILLSRIKNLLQEYPQCLRTRHLFAVFQINNSELNEVLFECPSFTPIFLATGQLALKHDAIANSMDSPLCIAIRTGNIALLQVLIEYNASLNLIYENNQNIFHFLGSRGEYSILKPVIDAWYKQYGSQGLEEKLLCNETQFGDTPAHIIMKKGDFKCVEFLLCNASMSVLGAENKKRTTPMQTCGRRRDFSHAWISYLFDHNKKISHLKSKIATHSEQYTKQTQQACSQEQVISQQAKANLVLEKQISNLEQEVLKLTDERLRLHHLNEALQVENLTLKLKTKKS